MRISYWSSDVCSSDLGSALRRQRPLHPAAFSPFRSRHRQFRLLLGGDGFLRDLEPQDADRMPDRDRRAEARGALLHGRKGGRAVTALAPPIPVLLDAVVAEIGSASGRERWCRYGSVSVGAVSL